MEIPVVYKALIRTKEELVSLWANSRLGVELTYKEGEITYAPKGSLGIFIETTLEKARGSGQSNWSLKKSRGYLVVHEATPLGSMLSKEDFPVSAFAMCDRYPAILLGKEVYLYGKEPEKPKEEWVDITEECTLHWFGEGSYLIKAFHKDRLVLLIGIGGYGFGKIPEIEKHYKLSFGAESNCGKWFKILHKQAI